MKCNTEIFINRSKIIHGDDFDYSKTIFKSWKDKTVVICNLCNKEYLIFPANHLKCKCKCIVYKKLPQNQSKTHEEFVKLAKEIHKDKFEYISQYKGNKKDIELKCNKCNSFFLQKARCHLWGHGCRKCAWKEHSKNHRMPIDEYESKCKKIHDEKYEYFQDFDGVERKIKIKCKKHNYIFDQYANNHLYHKNGCPICKLSSGEIEIEKWLNKNNIIYTIEKTFDNCRYKNLLKYDFYLNDLNILIEYDGGQHFKAIDFFGGEKSFELTKIRDEIKNKYCFDNNIN